MAKTFVIAECGSCHDGSFGKAQRLIETAKECGADAAKFQYWSSPAQLARRRNANEALGLYSQHQLPADWLSRLEAYCGRLGLEFMCTTYLLEDIAVVAPHVKRFKISSFEADDKQFVLAHLQYGKEIIVSHGMSGSMCDWPLYGVWRSLSFKHLHCVSAYPCPADQLNLRRMDDWYDGLSDHTTSVRTGGWAVAAGATIIEKHIRLPDTDPKNPDYGHSLPADHECWGPEGSDFAVYIGNIRDAEKALGDGVDEAMPCEKLYLKHKVKP